MRQLAVLMTLVLIGACLTGCGAHTAARQKPITNLPPKELIRDCPAAPSPEEAPTYGQLLILLAQKDAALDQCQITIDSIRKWRSDVEPNPD